MSGVPQNIFAATAPGAAYPPYVSLNEVNGEFQLTVRSPKRPGDVGGGSDACAPLTRDELERFADALNSYLAALP